MIQASIQQVVFIRIAYLMILLTASVISISINLHMKSNLKEFVQKFVQREVKNTFPHLYIVDKQTGPFRKIQDAIDAAEPHSLIKISEGFYQENITILKPIRIEPKSTQHQNEKIGVVLLVNSGNAITVKLPEIDNQCVITGIKISHSGNSQNHIKKQLMEHEHILNIFQSKERDIEQLQHEYVNRVSFTKTENTILMVEKGKISMQNCILSLNYLVKSCSTIIPAVCIQKEGTLAMHYCEIKGHPNKQTIGVICKLGRLFLQNSIVNNHSQGGVLIWGIGSNSSRIIKSHFFQNSIGIHAVGQQFKLKIYNNTISQNKIGVKIGLACEADINRNNITENIDGIEINSAFPMVYLNIIQKQQQNGIVCKSYKKFLCRAEIKKNIAIVGNKKNGILIEGENNRSKVVHNHLISFNGECGIKVMKGAFPLLVMNKVYKNYKQGILVVEKTNAIIQKNEITHNIDCNLALGGEGSHHSTVIQNIISHSSGPGIILINSGRCKIARNDICHNSEGIVMMQSRAEIRRNFISENKNNGIVCEDSSQPKLIENFITRNESMGAFFRDQSGGNISRGSHQSVIHSNIVVHNEIQMGLQEENAKLVNELQCSNTIEQNGIAYPEGVGCEIY